MQLDALPPHLQEEQSPADTLVSDLLSPTAVAGSEHTAPEPGELTAGAQQASLQAVNPACSSTPTQAASAGQSGRMRQ